MPKKTKSMRTFVREHRALIDNIARSVSGNKDLKLNDSDREDWVLNEEGLYKLAQSEGVDT